MALCGLYIAAVSAIGFECWIYAPPSLAPLKKQTLFSNVENGLKVRRMDLQRSRFSSEPCHVEYVFICTSVLYPVLTKKHQHLCNTWRRCPRSTVIHGCWTTLMEFELKKMDCMPTIRAILQQRRTFQHLPCGYIHVYSKKLHILSPKLRHNTVPERSTPEYYELLVSGGLGRDVHWFWTWNLS